MSWQRTAWPPNGFEIEQFEYGFWVLNYGGVPRSWCGPGFQQRQQLVGRSPAADHVFVAKDEVPNKARLFPPGADEYDVELCRRKRESS